LISGGRTTSTGSVPLTPSAASDAEPTAGARARSASMAYAQKRTGSLSVRSIVNQAKLRASVGAAPHSASRLVLPQPAGASSSVRRRGSGETSRCTSSSRAMRLRADTGAFSFVPSGMPAGNETVEDVMGGDWRLFPEGCQGLRV
jgi:hypothetical protein